MKETNTPEKNKKGFSDIFRKKTIERTVSETKESGRNLKRSISALELALMGVAVAVGAGIFSVGGQVVAFHAGPAAVVSFLIAGVVCALAVMCYAEQPTFKTAGCFNKTPTLPAAMLFLSLLRVHFSGCFPLHPLM